MDKKEIVVCNECGSKFFKKSSNMMGLCPECTYYLYGYPNCNHVFKNERCIYCYWDGSESDYIKWLKNNEN